MLQEGNLSFSVSDLSATFSNNEMIIFATVTPPSGNINQVWQEGPLVEGSPSAHVTTGPNGQSKGPLNLATGAKSDGGNSKLRRRNIHGILNAVSWGILMPLGITIARYMRVFKSADPAWFYLHIGCQFSGYVVGIASWGTGLKQGSESTDDTYSAHRSIGIPLLPRHSSGTPLTYLLPKTSQTLFTARTFPTIENNAQAFALLLRLKKDHKYRFYWNVYHHSVGYTVIVLAIINIFKGFDILNPEKKWKHAYVGAIIVLACNAIVWEIYTWYIVLKRKKAERTEKTPHGINGRNGYNGYGTGTPHDV
ncbi:hypothetical protein MLD38_021055 [Melastoma candidum]|uniref:Uncharacterized protein n=1 Tax=Melastoma candidum TaxID=119954 RepID=A0ACB9QEZ5_9MYRT|nr:hypothetical protein MLD38_021055 [Melastoma candidum]